MRVEDPTKSKTSTAIIIVALIVIAALIIGGLWFFLREKKANSEVWDMSKPVPEGMTVEYVEDEGLGHYVSFSTTEDTVHTIDIFEDPSCQFCRQFESEHGEAINDKVSEGILELNVHMMNFMDESTGMTYSDDASAVVIELAKSGDAVNAWRAYNQVWEEAPVEGTALDEIPTMDDMIAAINTSDAEIDPAVIQALETQPDIEGQRIYDSNITNTDSLIATTNRVSTPTVFFDEQEEQFEIGDHEYFESLFQQ